MNKMRLIHTGDWHLGRAFSDFPDAVAGELADARRTVVGRVAAAARGHGARHVLVAGDTFDRPDLPSRWLHAVLDAWRRAEDLTWHVISGNHDPLKERGVWDRVREIGLPANVRFHGVAQPTEIEAGTWLLPAPLSGASADGDPTAWMEQAATPEGSFRIGLAHGAARAFSGEHPKVLIAADRAKRAGLNYLALGDWHGALKLDAKTWYAGTPECDNFRTETSGQVLAVTIEGPGVDTAQVTEIPTAQHRWLTATVAEGLTNDIDALAGRLDGLDSGADRAIVRIVSSGATTPEQVADVEARLEQLAARVRHLDHRTRHRQIVVPAGAIEDLGDPSLIAIARTLQDDAASGTVAASDDALALLMQYAADTTVTPADRESDAKRGAAA
ncbi:MAG: metallophosphoesterase [Pseudomonadota bacterium]